MELTKQDILNKTNNGLNIYAFILRLYYPGETVVSDTPSGVQQTNNPFNNNRPTLMIRKTKEGLNHYDSEDSTFLGNCFDFASLHFHTYDYELLQNLNDSMKLNLLSESPNDKSRKECGFNNVSSSEIYDGPKFSFFKAPIRNTTPSTELTLLDAYKLIKGPKYVETTNILRNISDKKAARKYKANNFSYATFSGIFSKRNDKALLSHSNLLTIDIDHIETINALKKSLLKDEYFETELLFTSPSGDGLKWIIQIDLTLDTHKNYFTAISNYFLMTYGIEVDNSGKDVSRACFLPHDATAFIHPKYL